VTRIYANCRLKCRENQRLKLTVVGETGPYSVTSGKAKMQKTVTQSLTQSTDSETDGHGGVITVVLCCGESLNWPFVAVYQLATLCVCLPPRSNWHHIMFKLIADVILSCCTFVCHKPTADDESHRDWQLASRAANVPLLKQKHR